MALSALSQLYFVLVNKPEQEKITKEEANTIASCHLKAFWIAGLASGVGGGLGWKVAKKLKLLNVLGRLSLATGAATVAFSVTWDWQDSTTGISCLDYILRQDATRMQKELVNVLVRSNKGEAWRWELMSKHFYPEAVYNDEVDKPQMRWRRRTNFTEFAASYDESKSQKNGLPNGSDASKTGLKLNTSSGSSDGEVVEEDVLDIVFGRSEPTESVPAPVNTAKSSGPSSKTQTRKKKRALRRQRLKNLEAATNTPQYELA